MATTSVDALAAARGGRRPTSAVARFTQQLVWLDTPDKKTRVQALARRHHVSQACVLRAACERGLGALEAGLADGSIRADTLV